jgi:hypothetical protein
MYYYYGSRLPILRTKRGIENVAKAQHVDVSVVKKPKQQLYTFNP